MKVVLKCQEGLESFTLVNKQHTLLSVITKQMINYLRTWVLLRKIALLIFVIGPFVNHGLSIQTVFVSYQQLLTVCYIVTSHTIVTLCRQ